MKNRVFVFLVILFFFGMSGYCQYDNKIDPLISQLSIAKEDTNKLSLLIELAYAYKNIDNEQSIKFSKQALDLSQEINNDDYYCKSIIKYAYFLYVIDQHDSSLSTLNLAEGSVLALGDSLLIGELYILYGSIYRKQYKYEVAKQFLKRGISYSIFRETKIVGGAFNRLGSIYIDQSEYDSALYYYYKYLDISEKNSDTICEIASYINIGKLFFKLEDYEQAESRFLKSLELLKLKKHLDFESLTYMNLGMVHTKMKNYEKAISYYEKAFEIADKIGEEINKGDIINNIGSIYFEQGLYEEAQIQFDKSLEIFKRIGYVSGELTNRYNLSVMYSQNNDFESELAMLDTVIAIANENGLLEWIAKAYNNMAMTYYTTSKYKQAYDTLSMWIILHDSIFNIDKAESVAEIELKYEKGKNEAKILALQNETLQKDLEIKRKTNQRNIISGGGFAAVIILSLLFFLHRQRSQKNRIISEKEISRLKEEKKALAAQSIVEGQEEERKRVARELHDGLGVLLSNVKMQFSSFMDKSPENKDMLSKAASVLNQASVDVRRISHNMMPGNLSKFGLVAAIEDLFEEISESGVITAEIKTELTDERFTENKEIMLYRIVQEMANNTIKHAGASNISLNINRFDHKILVNFADNGSGFDPKKVKAETSLGLKSIEDRVNFLGGELSNESVPGNGASFSFDFPV